MKVDPNKGIILKGKKRVFPKIVGFPPKSSHGLIGFSIIFHHPFWGNTPIFGNIQIIEANYEFCKGYVSFTGVVLLMLQKSHSQPPEMDVFEAFVKNGISTTSLNWLAGFQPSTVVLGGIHRWYVSL